MPDSLPIYSSRQLVKLIQPLDRPQSFLRTLLFDPTPRLFDTRRIDFHVINEALEVARFVHPDSTAKATAERGFKIESFEPAYIKELTPLTPSTMLDITPGEIIGGNRSPLERRAIRTRQIMQDHEKRIDRRIEAMCSTILATGAITVEGDEYPAQTVSFGRDAGLTVALTTTARWGETGVSPMANMRTWSNLVSTKSGAAVDTCVMGDEAFELAIKEDEFKERLDNRRQAGGEMEMFLAPKGVDAWGVYQGRVGNVDYFTYSQPYREAGVAKNMMDSYGVILASRRQAENVVAFGAIMDMEMLQAATFWPKMYPVHNPSRTIIETASAPLPILVRPNATFYAKVR